jgi:hypothetical protein
MIRGIEGYAEEHNEGDEGWTKRWRDGEEQEVDGIRVGAAMTRVVWMIGKNKRWKNPLIRKLVIGLKLLRF